MKRYILIYIILLILIYACNNSQQKIVISEVVSDIDTNQVAQDWRKENWYKVSYEQLCDEMKGVFLDYKKVTKLGLHKPYDTLQVNYKDSTIISFEFISDCCMQFSGEVIHRNDTLFLGYGNASDTANPCDCYCDYKMRYKIDTVGKHWNKIIIKNGLLK